MVPEPGQQVRLLGWGTTPGGKEVRAISEPYTNTKGEVVVRVTEEQEYKDALREGRRAIGMPWPVKQMVILSPSETLDAPETAAEEPASTDVPPDRETPSSRPERRSLWRRFFGFE